MQHKNTAMELSQGDTHSDALTFHIIAYGHTKMLYAFTTKLKICKL